MSSKARRITKLGFQPVKISAEFYENVEQTVGGSPWQAGVKRRTRSSLWNTSNVGCR